MFHAPDSRREIVLDDCFGFSSPNAAHEQDAAGDARLSQLNAFIGGGNAQPLSSCAFQSTCTLRRAVSIGVALDHGTDRRMRCDEIANQAEIGGESRQRDLGPSGWRRHGFSLARSSGGFGGWLSAVGGRQKQEQQLTLMDADWRIGMATDAMRRFISLVEVRAAIQCGARPKMERKIPAKIAVLFFRVAAEEY